MTEFDDEYDDTNSSYETENTQQDNDSSSEEFNKQEHTEIEKMIQKHNNK